MSDDEFAEAVDALLWIGPSGESRDNRANLLAIGWTIEERKRGLELIGALLRSILPIRLWRDHRELAVPLLEALLFLQEQGASSDYSAGRAEEG
ncbi:MAG TPA: hypothetical protein VF168_14465 [Trueperaceae bacterium]